MIVNRSNANSINDTLDFVITRSFEMMEPATGQPISLNWPTAIPAPGPLGAVSKQIIIDRPELRQPVADHVVNLRFRYWHIAGNEMTEIRYDPDMTHIQGVDGSGPAIGPDDGYYRYYDQNGHEIYVWYNDNSKKKVPLWKTAYTQADWDAFVALKDSSFFIDGGVDGTDEFQRGLLLFEGWKYVNAVSITVKTANSEDIPDIYRSTINQNVSGDPTNPDYQMGFVDFGMGGKFTDGSGTANAYQPLYEGANNMRLTRA